jgi:hypothetical protein
LTINVSDISGNRNDKIANAAKVLGRSDHRRMVFSAISSGKKKVKLVSDIHKLTRLNRMRILQEAKKLASEDIIEQLEKKVEGETAYKKIDFYAKNKGTIISLSRNKGKLNRYPTKTNPQRQSQIVKVQYPRKQINIKFITIDDIDTFSNTRKYDGLKISPLYENKVKTGFKKIIREMGQFKDWGGETDDLFTTRIKIDGKRVRTAIGFKGKGTSGILTPKKMGKNGDQIQRLFRSPADVFLVQYCGQIHESIIEQMKIMAIAKSVSEGLRIYFGIIDGEDTSRMIAAYLKAFKQ